MSVMNRIWLLALVTCLTAPLGCSSTESGVSGGSGGDAGSGGEGGAGGMPPLDETFKAATCIRDITPVSPMLASAFEETFGEAGSVNHSDPIYMAGFGANRQATDYNDRLWARGVVIDGRGGRIALVALDLIGYFNNQVDIIRAMVGDSVDYLIVHSSHSHEGPDTLGIWGPDATTTGVDPMYLDFVNDAIADCIAEASDTMTAARVKSSTVQTAGLSLGIRVDDDGFGVADQKILDQFAQYEREGYGHYPICMAKTQYSFSTDPHRMGAPANHRVKVRELALAAGAEFLVVVCGDIMRMPGLPREPAANSIFINEQGQIEGLF